MNDSQLFKTSTILLVDDTSTNLATLFAFFTSVGLTVLVAQDGHNALRILEEGVPDIILLDVVMPGLNGFDVCRQIKSREASKDVPIIFMTALSEMVDKITGFACGAVDYVTKPFQLQEILARVKAHLLIRKLQVQLQEQVCLLGQEIEEHRRTEEALRESQEMFLQIADNVREIFFVVDRQRNKVIYVSPVYEAIWGQKRQSLYDNAGAWLDNVHTEDKARVQAAIERQNREQIEFDEEYRILRPLGGKPRWIWTQAFPVFNEQGEPYRLVGISEDITNRKRAEEALQESEAKLQRAKDTAEEANKAKSTFLASMSHELRTPLNGILGYTQILRRDTTITAKQQTAVNVIHQSGEHLLDMINDILDLSKIEAGKMELQPETFHLPNFLQGLADMVRIRAEQKGLLFHADIAPDLPCGILGDEKRLRQVILNLLSNAIKFTAHDKTVTFRVKRLMMDDCRLVIDTPPHQSPITNRQSPIRFEVEDQGFGISPERQRDIFLPFHQIHDQRVKDEGTGLGLPISQRLVRLMGGELQVKSVLNQGTTFWFDLIVPEASDSSVTEGETSQRTVIGYEGPHRKILVIDDEDSNRILLTEFLRAIGFEVQEAENGRDALEQAIAWHPDLMFMDLVLPEMDGFEATRQIRQYAELQDTVIIAVSASVFEHTKTQSLTAGCQAYLPKPLHFRDILALIQTHLNLTWIYSQGHHLSDELAHGGAGDIIPPSPEELSTLLTFAMMGDVLSLQERVRTLESHDPQLAPFSHKIDGLAQEFMVDELQEFIQKCLEDNA